MINAVASHTPFLLLHQSLVGDDFGSGRSSGLRFRWHRVGLVAAAIAADGCGVGDELNRRRAAWAEVRPVAGHGRGGLAGVFAQDETCLILQVGGILGQTFAVGDGQFVGAVRNPIKVACNEDQRQRKHGYDDESKTHGQSPWRVALETLDRLEGENAKEESEVMMMPYQ